MSSVQHLREFISERLTAAAEEIFTQFEKTIVQYETETVRLRRLLEISWKPNVPLQRIDLPQHYLCKEDVHPPQLLCSQDKDPSMDKEEQEPPHIKEEQEELCTSQGEEQFVLKQDTDTFMVTLVTSTYEESDDSKSEPNRDQLVCQSRPLIETQDQSGSGYKDSEACHVEKLKPMERHRRNRSCSYKNGNFSMLESPLNTDKDLLQQYVCKSEIPSSHMKKGPGMDQEPIQPLHIKEEQVELCTALEEEQFFVKQEINTITVTSACAGSDLSEPEPISEQLLPQCSWEGNWNENTEPTTSVELKPNEEDNANHSDSVTNESECNFDAGCRTLKCEVCEKVFKSYSKLKAHYGMHTDEKPYSCQLCKKTFRCSAGLLVHMRTHTGEKPFTCSICRKLFRYSGNLTTHMKIHTGEKPFSCSICGKLFRHSGNLTTHMKIHTGEKPYLCKTCGKRFSQMVTLRRHARIHAGEKPYPCKTCGHSFSSYKGLIAHKATHTGEKLYSCKTHDQYFSPSGSLLHHMPTHTGEELQS